MLLSPSLKMESSAWLVYYLLPQLENPSSTTLVTQVCLVELYLICNLVLKLTT